MKKILLTLCIIFSPAFCTQPQVQIKPIDANTNTIAVTFDLKNNEYLYRDFLDISIDHPDIALTAWQSNKEPVQQYDQYFNATKTVFKDSITLTMRAEKKRAGIQKAGIHIAYYINAEKCLKETIIPITFATAPIPSSDIEYAVDVTQTEITEKPATPYTQTSNITQTTAPSAKQSWADYLSAIAQTTQSSWVRILFAFLLGILLSLTPCIYPMIPITIGIMQSRGSKSLFNNFLLALSYVTGIATTFAALGLLAAFTGQLFGSIMANPLVVFIIVALLVYLALSMFGLYEMYIPQALQQNRTAVKKDSYLSAYLFGAISGSVASPCLSPGLVLLLSIVTKLGSVFFGFLLLFCFGLGLGLPLLIIGTFSGIINLLPRAGIWMVEIKKLFGFMMLGMCFYFLHAIIPTTVFLISITLFMGASGVWYLWDARRTQATAWRLFKQLLGIALIASSVLTFTHSYKALYFKKATDTFWYTDYQKAQSFARTNNKKIFVDIGAPFCSICHAIDNTILNHETVCAVLRRCVPVKIDGSDGNARICDLQQCYKVVGFPTYLLINGKTGALIKQWGSELYEKTPEEFAAELQGLL